MCYGSDSGLYLCVLESYSAVLTGNTWRQTERFTQHYPDFLICYQECPERISRAFPSVSVCVCVQWSSPPPPPPPLMLSLMMAQEEVLQGKRTQKLYLCFWSCCSWYFNSNDKHKITLFLKVHESSDVGHACHTGDVVFSGQDVASLEEFFGLSVDHQQFGLISSCFDGPHHLWVLHANHWHAIHLGEEGGGEGVLYWSDSWYIWFVFSLSHTWFVVNRPPKQWWQ